MKLTTKDYWEQAQDSLNIEIENDDIIKTWIDGILGEVQVNNVIEIGCYPGRYLTIFGKKGAVISGVDFIPNISHLEKMFTKNGYKVGEFIESDFFDFKTIKKYDCVMSFGFIEHFENWEEVIQMHINLVAKEGYLIIEAPNFRGFLQRLPRYLFDNKNYKRHNLNAMNLEKWNRIIEKNGFEIITSDYLGGYKLWFEKEYDNEFVLYIKRILIRVLRKIKNKFYSREKEHSAFSCAMGIIAKRK
jgi:SAM-dependent methyltransferase